MDRIAIFRKTIEKVFDEYANYPHLPEGIRYDKIMDEKNDRYQLVRLGWTTKRRVYAVIFHVDIINGKIWVQQDNTEVAIANLLLEKDIQKSEIVLGYFSETRRKYSDFAAA